MTDRRFEWTFQISRPIDHAEQARVQAQVRSLEGDKVIQQWLKEWWSGWVKTTHSTYLHARHRAQLDKSYLGVIQGKDFFEDFKSFVQRDGKEGSWSSALKTVIPGVIANSISAKELEMDKAGAFFDERGVWCEFAERLVIRIKASETQKKSWNKVLAPAIENPRDLFEFYSRDTVAYDSLEIEAKRRGANFQPTFDDVRDAMRVSHLHLKSSIVRRLDLLSRTSPAAFVALVDSIQFDVVKCIIAQYLHIFQNKEVVICWIERAPNSIDASGRVVSSQLMLGLYLAIEYARSLEHAVRHCAQQNELFVKQRDIWLEAQAHIATLESTELPSWFATVYDLVLARSDGVSALIDMCVGVLRTLVYMTSENASQWNADKTAYEELCKAFDRHCIALKKVRERAKHWKSGSQTRDYIANLLLFAIDVADSADQAEINALRAWYRELLMSCDEDIVSHVNRFAKGPRWVFRTIGSLYGADEVSVAELKSLWSALYEQRLRHRFESYGSKWIDPSRHLVTVLRGRLDLGLSTTPRAPDAELMEAWDTAIEHLLLLYLPYVENRVEDDCDALVDLFLYTYHAFGTGWPKAIQKVAAIMKSNPDLAGAISNALCANKVPFDEIEVEFAKFDLNLPALMAEAKAWAEL